MQINPFQQTHFIISVVSPKGVFIEAENRRLKKLVAKYTEESEILREVLKKL